MSTATRLTTAMMTVGIGAAAWLACAPVQAQGRDEPAVQRVVITGKRLTAEERAAVQREPAASAPVQRVEIIGRRLRASELLAGEPALAPLH
jgi:hypothetical protein